MKLQRTQLTEPDLLPPAAPQGAAEPNGATLPPPKILRATESPLDALVAIPEALGFPFYMLPDLPTSWTLVLETLGGKDLVITTRRQDYEHAARFGVDVVNGRWCYPMALAAEYGRGNRASLDTWLTRSHEGWELTPEAAIDGIPGCFGPRGWATERVLKAYALRLCAVD